MANSIFFDANVLIEIIGRRSNEPAARAILARYATKGAISTLTGHLVIHFGKKDKALSALKAFLSDYQLLALEPVDFEWAFNNIRDDDSEDSLELAVAIRNGCDRFLTFDKVLYKNYKSLPSISVELIK